MRPDHIREEEQIPAASAESVRRRVRREALAVAMAALAVVVATGLGLWLSSAATIRSNYRHYLIGLAQSAASQVDPQLHERLRHPDQRDSPDYLRAVEPLVRMRTAVTDVRFIYTAIADGDVVRFILDTGDANAGANGRQDRASIGEVFEGKTPATCPVFGVPGRTGAAVASRRPHTDRWGTFMTGWAPLVDASGRQYGAVGVDVDADVYVARLANARNWMLFGLLPAGLLIVLLALGFYRTRLRAVEAAGAAARAMQVLALEQQRLRSIVEGTAVGTWVTDLDTDHISVDERWAEMIGSTPEQIGPLTEAKFLAMVHPEDRDATRAAIAKVLSPGSELLEVDLRLRHAAGHWVWIRVRGNVIERFANGRARRMVGTHVDISARKSMELELADAATRDRLTGLGNRALFLEKLQVAIQRVRAGRQVRFAVLFLDFDRFKLVNDSMGHEAGDALLREIAQRLRRALRASDDRADLEEGNLIARFGGDEFLVLMNDMEQAATARRIADRLLATLSPAYLIQGREVHSTASIGVVTSDQSLESAEAVVRNADMAMYEAKRGGGGCAVMFDEAMYTQLTRHVAIETGLRKALGTPELSLVYQPIVDLESGRTVSVEALARWQHPELGVVSPGEFVPVAEESGLVVQLGEWVLRESCAMLMRWRTADPASAPATISINTSRAELALGERFLARVRTALAETRLPANCLQIEVTEREVMRDPLASLRLMEDLRELGVHLAMDDFGTGTSSLGCLRDYPFDVIKIDRSFMRDMVAQSSVLPVIHATIALAENLGKRSVAEGVENAAQVAILQALGCHHAQGYYFSPPLQEAELIARGVNPAAEHRPSPAPEHGALG